MATAIQHTFLCEDLNAYAHEKRCGACGHHEIRYVTMQDINDAVRRGKRLQLRPLEKHKDCRCFKCLMSKGNQRGRLRAEEIKRMRDADDEPFPPMSIAEMQTEMAAISGLNSVMRGETPAEAIYRIELQAALWRVESRANRLRSDIQGTTQAMSWRHRSVLR